MVSSRRSNSTRNVKLLVIQTNGTPFLSLFCMHSTSDFFKSWCSLHYDKGFVLLADLGDDGTIWSPGSLLVMLTRQVIYTMSIHDSPLLED